MRGRKPKPAELKIVQGNPGKRKPLGQKKVVVATPKRPPTTLSVIGGKYWERLLPELAGRGGVTAGDLSLLETVCKLQERRYKAQRVLDEEGLTYLPKGRTIIRKRPEIDIVQACERELRHYYSELALSPTARARSPEIPQGAGSTSDRQDETEEFLFGI